MMDVAEERGISIKKELLATALDAPVVGLSANHGTGIDELKNLLQARITTSTPSKKQFAWLPICSKFREAAEDLGKSELSSGGKLPLILKGAALFQDNLPFYP